MENKIMKDWMNTWENTMNTWMNDVAKNQNFIKNFMKTYEPMMKMNKNLRDTQEKFYAQIGMATKNDMTLISQKIHDVEIKLADLQEGIEEIQDTQKEIMMKLNRKPVAKKTTTKKTTAKKTAAKK